MRISQFTIAYFWLAVVIIFAVAFVTFNKAARGELCLAEIDHTIAKKPGYRWQYRTIDGRKCWFYSNRLIPKTDLIWSYRSHDFDEDVRVIERKYFWPELIDGELKLREPKNDRSND